jgi:hypothetical protein
MTPLLMQKPKHPKKGRATPKSAAVVDDSSSDDAMPDVSGLWVWGVLVSLERRTISKMFSFPWKREQARKTKTKRRQAN